MLKRYKGSSRLLTLALGVLPLYSCGGSEREEVESAESRATDSASVIVAGV